MPMLITESTSIHRGIASILTANPFLSTVPNTDSSFMCVVTASFYAALCKLCAMPYTDSSFYCIVTASFFAALCSLGAMPLTDSTSVGKVGTSFLSAFFRFALCTVSYANTLIDSHVKASCFAALLTLRTMPHADFISLKGLFAARRMGANLVRTMPFIGSHTLFSIVAVLRSTILLRHFLYD